tara:strand:- start:1933 stop:3162 length:1230 start_codon:yes stop_codon:yes gene_type:complete
MPKNNIGSIFEKNRNIFSYQESRDFIEPRTIIGVEVELENMHEASGFAHNGIRNTLEHDHFSFDGDTRGVLFGTGYWNVKSDGSLRNGGVEFVTKKLFGKDLSIALDELNEYLNDEGESLDDTPSDRCSVHIHLDVTDLDKNEYARLLIDYAIFERVLFNYCGADRGDNIYCLPFAKSDDFKRTLSHILTSVSADLDFRKYVNSFPKYSALNLRATSTYGSLEFRLHGGTYDMMRVKEWINIIMCLKKNCRGNTAHNLHREISRYGISNYLEKVFGHYHRILDYDKCESDIIEGVRLAQDILLYNSMRESCKNYFKNNNILLDNDSNSYADQITEYLIPFPLNKYMERINKEQGDVALKYAVSKFFSGVGKIPDGGVGQDNPFYEEEYREEEEYDEERDYDEEEYYDEE